MTKTANQARNTTIFVIENGKIETTTLFEHVMSSAEKTTSPRGVMNVFFYEENQGQYEVLSWSMPGRFNTPRVVDTYNNEEEAENHVFESIYKFDFLPDDQRDTYYALTMEEAEKELNERVQ